MELEVLGQFLHLQERSPRGIADHGDPVPFLILSQELRLDVGQEDQFGPDGSERTERRIAVVGFASGQLGLSTIGVDSLAPVAHEVDHPDRTVVLRCHRLQSSGVVVINGAVGEAGKTNGAHCLFLVFEEGRS